jgi:hypothetical protein
MDAGAVSRTLLATAIAMACSVASAPVWACPQCALRDGYDGFSIAALGIMIIVPFGIAAMLWPILGRAGTAQGALATESLTDRKIRSEWQEDKR